MPDLNGLSNLDVVNYAISCGLLDFEVNGNNPIRYESSPGGSKMKIYINDKYVGSIFLHIGK